jgi:broad specificity phosphatase PhoE
MGTLYLVRHGQASFGAADYDQLSPLGQQQCERLGQYWREHGERFDAVLIGSLRRHQQSMAGIAEGLGGLPEAEVWPGLNEYDPQALVRAIHPAPLPPATTQEGRRQHFRLLQDGLLAWMTGASQPEGLPPHAEFLAGVMGALDRVRALAGAKEPARVLIVSSGGPISMAVGAVLDASATATVALNMRLRNSAITEFAVTPRRHALVSFNGLPHLDTPALRDWHSHA